MVSRSCPQGPSHDSEDNHLSPEDVRDLDLNISEDELAQLKQGSVIVLRGVERLIELLSHNPDCGGLEVGINVDGEDFLLRGLLHKGSIYGGFIKLRLVIRMIVVNCNKRVEAEDVPEAEDACCYPVWLFLDQNEVARFYQDLTPQSLGGVNTLVADSVGKVRYGFEGRGFCTGWSFAINMLIQFLVKSYPNPVAGTSVVGIIHDVSECKGGRTGISSYLADKLGFKPDRSGCVLDAPMFRKDFGTI